jgi:hypothetical protein
LNRNIMMNDIRKNTIWVIELIWKDFNLTLLMYSSSMGSLENDMKYRPNKKLKKDRVSVITLIVWFNSVLNKPCWIEIQKIKPIGNRRYPIFLKRLGKRNEGFILMMFNSYPNVK